MITSDGWDDTDLVLASCPIRIFRVGQGYVRIEPFWSR